MPMRRQQAPHKMIPCKSARPLPHGSSALFCTPGPVVIQLPLVVQKLFPSNGDRMGIQQDNRPVFLREATRSPFDPWFFSSHHAAEELAPSIRKGPSRQGTVPPCQHP